MIATDSTQDTSTEMHDMSNIGSTHEHQQGGHVFYLEIAVNYVILVAMLDSI